MPHQPSIAAHRFAAALLATVAILALGPANAQAPAQSALTMPMASPSTVTVTAAATASVANDRMHAWLRAESENVDPAKAANDVNAKTARAIARAKTVAGVETATTGYSSYQVTEKLQPNRWRVSQTISVQGADFAVLAGLVTRLQGDDGLLLTGMNFSVSDGARRTVEDSLTQQAIKSWQGRAQNAAQALGFVGWHVGRVTVQTGDYARPQPMMRVASAMSAQGAPPVAVEAGNSDVTVTVTGDAILDSTGTRPR